MTGALVVDDEAPVREAILALGNWDAFDIAPVREAADAVEALRILDQDTSITIVLSDMRMPEFDGAWLLSQLSTRRRGYAIIIISGHTDFLYTRQAVRSQAIDYILKPVDPDDLNSALASAVEAVRGPEPPASGQLSDTLVEAVKVFAEEHYGSVLSLGEIASRFSVSREHLSRRFKRSTGMNLFEYIARRRVESAKHLLESTDLPVKRIAGDTGFADEHYFSKAFKKWTGESPTDFRSGFRAARRPK